MKWQEAAEQSKRRIAVRVVTAPSGRPIAIINRYLDGGIYRYDMRCGKVTELKPAEVEGYSDWTPGK